MTTRNLTRRCFRSAKPLPRPQLRVFEVTPAQVLDRQCRCTAVDVATAIVSGRGWPASGKGSGGV